MSSIKNSPGQIWQPRIVLGYDPASELTCRGETLTGKRCQRPIGKPRRDTNGKKMQNLGNAEPDLTVMRPVLGQILLDAVCYMHVDQVPGMHEQLCALLRQAHPQKPPPSQKPLPTSPPQHLAIRTSTQHTATAAPPPTPTCTNTSQKNRILELENELRDVRAVNRAKDRRVIEVLEFCAAMQMTVEAAVSDLARLLDMKPEMKNFNRVLNYMKQQLVEE